MNAVIDEDLPRAFSVFLSSLGFTPLDVRDHGLRGESDEEVYVFAQQKKAVLFSADLGFSNLLTFPLGTHWGICILRFPNEVSTAEMNRQATLFLSKLSASDYKGNLVILSPGRMRLRRKRN